MNILYLYAEMVPSWLPIFRVLHDSYDANIHVVHWNQKKLTPYIPPAQPGVYYYKRSDYDADSILSLINQIEPAVIFVSGWQDKEYLKAIFRRSRKVPTIAAFDDWWVGSLRQKAGSLIPRWFSKKLFTHAWVAGARQYEFAKHLGFKEEEIIFNLFSADTSIFKAQCCNKARENNFLYVGRFSPEKGLSLLVDAYSIYRKKFLGSWKLVCTGNGPLETILSHVEGIEVVPFLDPAKLINYFNSSSAFVMPSFKDNYPLVVHEAACSGMPLILSKSVGSGDFFLIHNYNGYLFESGSPTSLAETMKKMEDTHVGIRDQMGCRSLSLSKRQSPELCAASLLSIIK